MNIRCAAASMITALSIASVSPVVFAGDDALTLALADVETKELATLLNKNPSLSLSVQMQFRYQANIRDDASTTITNPDDDVSIGFVMRRLKLEASSAITDNLKAKLVLAVDRKTGTAFLEDTYADWKVSDDVTLRIGQFKLPILREEIVSSKRQLAVERSATNETFTQNRSQGIQANFGGEDWRAMLTFSDGIESDNTTFNDSAEADYSFTARGEMKFGEATFRQFRQFTSFRGATSGGLLGGAVSWQTMGETNPATAMPTDMLLLTGDFSWIDDGWNAYAALIYRNTDNGMMSFDDIGAVVQGGFFVAENTELYGRWDAVFPDSSRGTTGNDFHSVSFGVNHYLIPESHAAKFTFGVSIALDPTTESIVSTSDGHNLLPDSESGQIELMAQMHLLF
ncbi:MAG: porin [Phycisphaerales bacterium]